eukprot:24138-Hanusia_phi.AAC.2
MKEGNERKARGGEREWRARRGGSEHKTRRELGKGREKEGGETLEAARLLRSVVSWTILRSRSAPPVRMEGRGEQRKRRS